MIYRYTVTQQVVHRIETKISLLRLITYITLCVWTRDKKCLSIIRPTQLSVKVTVGVNEYRFSDLSTELITLEHFDTYMTGYLTGLCMVDRARDIVHNTSLFAPMVLTILDKLDIEQFLYTVSVTYVKSNFQLIGEVNMHTLVHVGICEKSDSTEISLQFQSSITMQQQSSFVRLFEQLLTNYTPPIKTDDCKTTFRWGTTI